MATIDEKRILKLEKASLPYDTAVPGTSISRVMLDNSLLEKVGLDTEKATGEISSFVWCLALGPSWEPKAMFYGYTIEEAIKQAEKAIKQAEKGWVG